MSEFKLLESEYYDSCHVLGLGDDETTEDLLGDPRCPDQTDVLVICPGRLLSSPPPAAVGSRRLSVVPCGSTPITDDQLSYFLSVIEQTDNQLLAARAGTLFDRLSSTDVVTLTDEKAGTSATFGVREDYEWNQQAGPLEAGEQQIAPAGEASAVPTDLYHFDTSRHLEVDGTIAAHGAPIVHAGADPDAHGKQQRLYTALDTCRDATLVLEVEGGLVRELRPADPGAGPAADALADLFGEDENYRRIWEFGIGLHPGIAPQPGNCGMNEMFGSTGGVLHLGFGLTPTTTFALTLTCDRTVLRTRDGVLVAGAGPRRRLDRRRAADCGCVEN